MIPYQPIAQALGGGAIGGVAGSIVGLPFSFAGAGAIIGAGASSQGLRPGYLASGMAILGAGSMMEASASYTKANHLLGAGLNEANEAMREVNPYRYYHYTTSIGGLLLGSALYSFGKLNPADTSRPLRPIGLSNLLYGATTHEALDDLGRPVNKAFHAVNEQGRIIRGTPAPLRSLDQPITRNTTVFSPKAYFNNIKNNMRAGVGFIGKARGAAAGLGGVGTARVLRDVVETGPSTTPRNITPLTGQGVRGKMIAFGAGALVGNALGLGPTGTAVSGLVGAGLFRHGGVVGLLDKVSSSIGGPGSSFFSKMFGSPESFQSLMHRAIQPSSAMRFIDEAKHYVLETKDGRLLERVTASKLSNDYMMKYKVSELVGSRVNSINLFGEKTTFASMFGSGVASELMDQKNKHLLTGLWMSKRDKKKIRQIISRQYDDNIKVARGRIRSDIFRETLDTRIIQQPSVNRSTVALASRNALSLPPAAAASYHQDQVSKLKTETRQARYVQYRSINDANKQAKQWARKQRMIKGRVVDLAMRDAIETHRGLRLARIGGAAMMALTVGSLAVQGIKALHDVGLRASEKLGTLQNKYFKRQFGNGQFVNTRQAQTERELALQSIRTSNLARQTFGTEGALYH